MTPILEVHDLVTRFYTEDGVVHAVNGVSYKLNRGESIGIVGESGSGKSVSVMSMLGLIPTPPGRIERGEVRYDDVDLLKISPEALRNIRGKEIAMIFQDPMTSLNPVITVGLQLTEALHEHFGTSEKDATERAVEILNTVGIPNARDRLNDYPHQFSGGQRQRLMIAMALTCNPSILIADEPTTALDVTIQAQIVELIKQLKESMGMAIIWITHDLGVVAGLVDKMIVMYAGYIVEEASVRKLYKETSHPYTKGLLESIPILDAKKKKRLATIKGLPPNLLEEPTYCPFAPRCPFAIEKCLEENPPLFTIAEDHKSACWRWEDVRKAERFGVES
ncbi:MAG: ABC transporter ATP-binding protein [Chloroflexota bacterium]